jgi:hypothetical protein
MDADSSRLNLDLEDILHPAQAFDHPSDVVNDPDLTVNEKRAILASWASDICAVEAAPDLRAPTPGKHVRFDEIMEALRELDQHARVLEDVPYRRSGHDRRRRQRGDGSHGVPSQ